MHVVLWAAPLVPALAAALVRWAPPRAAGSLAALGAALSAIPAVALLAAAGGGTRTTSGFAWLPAAPNLEVGLRLDPLSAAMSATVAGVGAVVMLYAAGYFAEAGRRREALAGLLFFLALMQGLVLADGYLALLLFWEGVGAMSARLIAWNRRDSRAPGGAVRAFLTTRTADLGLYLAVFALYSSAGTLAFGGERPAGVLGALVGGGLLAAAMGKSAQAPLQTWLTGAMAGPTPVSALLHSATMVAAGVYLLMRSQALLAGWPLELAGWVGAVTAVAGAVIALGQDDLKRVLAGSTTSQLGLMFVGVAAGGPAVGLFHLVTHAVGKSGLFLAAGIFQHGRASTDLARLRGAGRDDRPAFAGFVVCALSIAAVPPLAAFWSKDHIAAAAQHRAAWFALVLLAAAGSAAYLLRPALLLWGRRSEMQVVRARTGRRPMLAALGVLVAGSLGLGALGGPLRTLLDAPPLPESRLALALSLIAVVAGAAAVLAQLPVPRRAALAAREQLYTNDLLRIAAERPVLALAAGADVVERRVIDRAVDGIGRAGLAAARAQDWVERHAVDAAVNRLAALVGRGGEESRRLQSGRLYQYLRDSVIGAAAVATVIALAALL